MRAAVLVACAGAWACGGPAPPASPPVTVVARSHAAVTVRAPDAPPVDPIVELARSEYETGWVVPRAARLQRRDVASEPPAGAAPERVQVLEHGGGELRIGVRLEAARFALWTEPASLLGTLTRDTPIGTRAGAPIAPFAEVATLVLFAGAHVTVLAREAARSHVRYEGAIDVDGWIPNDAVGDQGPAKDRLGYVPSGWRTVTVLPGTAIRAAPTWGSPLLAVVDHGYFVDDVVDLGAGVYQVAYRDSDVLVHGFVNLHAPPEIVRSVHIEAAPPAPVTPTATVASGTCLYARARGEAIGFIVGDAAVDIEPAQGSWFAITLDSPWGPLTFAAQGASIGELVACAPAGSVPPTRLHAP